MAKKNPADADTANSKEEQVDVIQPTRRTVNRLSFQQRTLVAQAMNARRDELLGDRPHLQDVADLLTEVLGFPATTQHVRTGMEDSGVAWKPGRRRWAWPVSRWVRLWEKLEGAIQVVPRGEPEPYFAAEYARAEDAAEAFGEAARLLKNKYEDGLPDEDDEVEAAEG